MGVNCRPRGLGVEVPSALVAIAHWPANFVPRHLLRDETPRMQLFHPHPQGLCNAAERRQGPLDSEGLGHPGFMGLGMGYRTYSGAGMLLASE